MPLNEEISFGSLLKQLRKRASMTQRDLAAALNYSDSLISSLENSQALPDLEVVITGFVPALGLQDDPAMAALLIEQAAAARGERPPASVSLMRARRVTIDEEADGQSNRLPLSPTALIGRSAEVNQICNCLLGHSGRLLTLVGPPGIGKTRLALAVAAGLQHHFSDGALFVPLAEITDTLLVASAIMAAVGINDSTSKPPTVKLVESLRRKSLLLVMDNCEQIRDAAPFVAELLSSCPRLVVLATSRERLHLRAEQRYQVPSLALAAAVELFTQRATAIDPNFAITEPNRPLVEAICQRLDRLPLAIELCAAQIDLLSLPQLLAGLKAHPLDLLVAGAQDLPPPQRTLRTAIGRSYALLNQDEQKLFRSLGVFVGGFELTALAMVGYATPALEEWRLDNDLIPPSVLSALRTLVSKSLVHSEPLPSGEQRFLLLETLREFALEQLQAKGEETEVRHRHYLAYLRLFRTGDSYLRRAEATTWSARLEVEQDNLRTALQWTFAATRYTDMAWLLLAASHFWAIYGHRYENARWYARLLLDRQALPVDLCLAIFIGFIPSASDLAEFHTLGEYRAEIIELMEVCPSKQMQSVAWHFLAESDAEVARAYALACEASEAPDLGPEFGGMADHEFVLAAIQLGYADSLLHQGEVAQAALLVTDSLHRFRKQANYAFIADCLGMLGELALLRGDIAEAHSYLQEGVTIGQTHNLPVVLAEWQSLLGLVTLYSSDVSEAHRLLEEALRLCLEAKNSFYLMQVCTFLAEAALWEGEIEQAAHWLAQSLAYEAPSARITLDELQRLFIAARLATVQGHYSRAAILLGLATAAHRQIHSIYAGPMLPLVNAALLKVREALGAELFDEAFAAGQQLSLNEAYTTFLAPAQITSIVTLPTST